MKKVFVLIAIMLCCCGCADTTELGDRAIIQLAAVDYSDGEYTLNALLFSAGGSGGEIDVTKDNVIKVTGSGATLADAVQQLSLTDGKEIYMSEAKLLVLGSGFQHKDMISVIDMLHRDMRCSLNMPVCCAENAEMLTDMTFTEGITAAEKPVSMIENAYLSGVSPKATVLDILADHEAGRETLLPYFTETVNGRGVTKSDDGRTAVLNGAKLISAGRLTQYISPYCTAGYMLLHGLTDSVTVSIEYEGAEYACEAYNIIVSDDGGVKANYRTRSGSPMPEQAERLAQQRLERCVSSAISY